jgi:hypothetical protein
MAKQVRVLPRSIAERVGRIVALWSQQETILRNILANAAGVNIKVARVVFREPKTEEFGVVLKNLLLIARFQVSDSLNEAVKALTEAKEMRDTIISASAGRAFARVLSE